MPSGMIIFFSDFDSRMKTMQENYDAREKEYLELELQKKDLETRIARNLESGDCAEAQHLCDKLAAIVEQMQHS